MIPGEREPLRFGANPDDVESELAAELIAALGRALPRVGRALSAHRRARRARAAGARLRALSELRRVLRVEWAAALRVAASLRCEHEPCAARHARLDGGPDRARWERRARRLARLCALDGVAEPEAARLRALLRSVPAEWPSAVALAEEALAAHPCDRGRLVLARALLAAGEPAAAQDVLTELLRRDPPPALRRRAFERLASAHEERGSDRLAHALFEAAAEAPGRGLGARVSSLFLALALGDAAAAARAAVRLDSGGAAPDAPRFLRALERLCARESALRGLPLAPPPAVATLFRELARSRTRSGAVCRAVG